jgi:hypothetical protein
MSKFECLFLGTAVKGNLPVDAGAICPAEAERKRNQTYSATIRMINVERMGFEGAMCRDRS